MRITLWPLIVALGMAAGACAGGYSGRRITRAEVTMVYDPGYRVYVVESYPDVYYSGGFYFRLSSGTWVRSRRVDGPWESFRSRHLPPGLRKKFGHDEGKGHKRGHKG